MKVTSKKSGEGKVRLSVVVPADEMLEHIEQNYKMLAYQMQIKPEEGKDAKTQLIERMGADDLRRALDSAVMNRLTPFAITEKDLSIAGKPSFFSEESVVEGKDFSFSVQLSLKPEYDLESYEPVEVVVPSITFDESEIQDQLAQIAKARATQIKDDSHDVVQKDDYLIMAIETKQGDEVLPGLTAESRPYQTGQFLMPDDFDNAVIGMKVGETKTFDFEAPTFEFDENNEPLMDTYTATVTVLEIQKEVVPAITDAWVKENIPGCETVPDFEARLKEEIIKHKEGERAQYTSYVCASELAKRFKGKIADELYEAAFADLKQNFEMQLKQQGISREDWMKQQGMDEQQMGMMMMFQAREQLAQGFSLDALAKHLGLTVDEEDYDKVYKSMAPGKEFMVKKEFEGTGRLFVIKEAAMRMKANEWLVSTATIKEPPAQPVDAPAAAAPTEAAAEAPAETETQPE